MFPILPVMRAGGKGDDLAVEPGVVSVLDVEVDRIGGARLAREVCGATPAADVKRLCGCLVEQHRL